MHPPRRIALVLLLAAIAGCGGDDTIQIKTGPITEEEKAQIRSHDEQVESQERANTPTAASLKKR